MPFTAVVVAAMAVLLGQVSSPVVAVSGGSATVSGELGHRQAVLTVGKYSSVLTEDTAWTLHQVDSR